MLGFCVLEYGREVALSCACLACLTHLLRRARQDRAATKIVEGGDAVPDSEDSSLIICSSNRGVT